MGVRDEYCTVCGGPPYAIYPDVKDKEGQPLNRADYNWLGSYIGISNEEELIPLASYDSYGAFDIQADTSLYKRFFLMNYTDGEWAGGYACHVSCYNLLQQELKYTLKHADVEPLLVDNGYDYTTFPWSDYGGLREYHCQSFLQEELVRDGKLWMIEDPSRNAENKERILRVWRPLVESGFKRPDATVGDGSRAPEIAETNMDESRA